MSGADLRLELASALTAGGEAGPVNEEAGRATNIVPVPRWWAALFVWINTSKGCVATKRKFTDDDALIIFSEAATCLEKQYAGLVEKMGEVLLLVETLRKEILTFTQANHLFDIKKTKK